MWVRIGRENILSNWHPSCFLYFQLNKKLEGERSRGLSASNTLIRKVNPWALFLFAILVHRCGESTEQLFDPGLVHWDHVCGGTPHPGCTRGLLCAEKQRWQVCRYATVAPASGHVLHGKRSVSLWPGFGLLAILLQDVNQNWSHELHNNNKKQWQKNRQSVTISSYF